MNENLSEKKSQSVKTALSSKTSNLLQSPRGTQDLLPETCEIFRGLDQRAYHLASLYGYKEINTPIFEFSNVFHRTLGETSDMVSKETYTFLDRGNDELTLRPEGTAGIARAFISNGMAQNLPLKFYYFGPMFRYERPQKGRYRQFHQLGVESLGYESPYQDVESIALAYHFLETLGLKDKVQLELNTLGDSESRLKHRELLVSYLNDFASELSKESQLRLEKNPLRILDSKDEGDRRILEKAPSIESCLNSISKDFFEQVQRGLEALKISFVINPHLVRGIDYYTHTVFEITTKELGAQGTVVAGGRYDGLIEQMGGPKTAGFGWASGVERLALLVDPAAFKREETLIAFMSADATASSSINSSVESMALSLVYQLRQRGHRVEFLQSGSLSKKMKRSNKMGASYAVILGEAEMKNKEVAIKDLKKGEQKNITHEELLNYSF